MYTKDSSFFNTFRLAAFVRIRKIEVSQIDNLLDDLMAGYSSYLLV